MKHTEEEIEIIAKSMYKAVKKALGTAISDDSKDRARAKAGKEVVADVLDPNFIAESKAKVPPRRESTMNKATRSAKEHDKKVKSGEKSKWQAKYKPTKGKEKGVHLQDKSFPKKKGQSLAGSHVKGNVRRATSDWGMVSNKENKEDIKEIHQKVINEQKKMKKPNLPKSERNMVKAEKGINKLKSFIKNKHK